MGYVPIVPTPRLPKDPYRWPASYVAELEERLQLRHSRFRRRRRRAHTACLLLIRWRERQLQPLPAAMGAGAVPGPKQDLESVIDRVVAASALIPPKPPGTVGVTGATGVVSSGSGWIGATGATGPDLRGVNVAGQICTAGVVTGGCGCTVCIPPASQFPRPHMVEIESGEEVVEFVTGDGRRFLVPRELPSKPPADASPFRAPPIEER